LHQLISAKAAGRSPARVVVRRRARRVMVRAGAEGVVVVVIGW
jgi:non-homologous end joining protein Ku